MTHVSNTPQDALAQAAQLELGQNPNALAIRRPFDPTAHELEANFRLTRYTVAIYLTIGVEPLI